MKTLRVTVDVNTPGPRRVQQRRTKGFRLPPNTVSVARPHRWGNPYRISRGDGGRIIITDRVGVIVAHALTMSEARRVAVDRYRAAATPAFKRAARAALAGKNLACFCGPGDACHADPLLEWANEGET